MRTDGQTDMMKLILAFRNFTKASKKRHRIQNYETQGCARAHPMRTRMVLRIILEPNRREVRGSCKNYIMMSFINGTICTTLLNLSNKES